VFRIFPATIHDNRKVPLIENWANLATTDPVQHKAWTDYFGDKIKLWGMPTGPRDDLFVLDVDVKHENDNGFNTIQSENLQIPQTMTQTTMSGGKHYIFKYPKDGQEYGNRVKFKPGLDIRGAGGWIAYYGTDATPIGEAPEWVSKEALNTVVDPSQPTIMIAPEIAQVIFDNALEAIREAPEGEGNDVLNVETFKVGQLVASNAVTKEYAEAELLKAAMDRGRGAYESKKTIESGLKGGCKKPLTSPFGSDAPTPHFDIPPPPEPPGRWTPAAFTPQELTDVRKLRKPQLFKDWSTEDIHLTTADGGTGKTTLKLYEAICLALALPFLGFDCLQSGRTLFITGEDSRAKIGAMIGAILKQMNMLHHIDHVTKSIFVKCDTDLNLITKDRQGFLTYNPDAVRQLTEAVEDIKPKFIVFDPISSFWGSESSLNDMAKAVSKLMMKLVETSEGCVEMINHVGKSSSANKDMTQFSGRGGTGLPSHSRVSRALRPVYEDEYRELTGDFLVDGESAILCNVNKFTDGSPLYNKPFIILRKGYLFSRKNLTEAKAREKEKEFNDSDRIFDFIKESRSNARYPTREVCVAHFMNHAEPIAAAATKRALNLLAFNGVRGEMIKMIDNPDVSITDKAYVIVDMDGREV